MAGGRALGQLNKAAMRHGVPAPGWTAAGWAQASPQVRAEAKRAERAKLAEAQTALTDDLRTARKARSAATERRINARTDTDKELAGLQEADLVRAEKQARERAYANLDAIDRVAAHARHHERQAFRRDLAILVHGHHMEQADQAAREHEHWSEIAAAEGRENQNRPQQPTAGEDAVDAADRREDSAGSRAREPGGRYRSAGEGAGRADTYLRPACPRRT